MPKPQVPSIVGTAVSLNALHTMFINGSVPPAIVKVTWLGAAAGMFRRYAKTIKWLGVLTVKNGEPPAFVDVYVLNPSEIVMPVTVGLAPNVAPPHTILVPAGGRNPPLHKHVTAFTAAIEVAPHVDTRGVIIPGGGAPAPLRIPDPTEFVPGPLLMVLATDNTAAAITRPTKNAKPTERNTADAGRLPGIRIDYRVTLQFTMIEPAVIGLEPLLHRENPIAFADGTNTYTRTSPELYPATVSGS